MNGFIYQILTNLKRDKNRKQKLSFLSPVTFKDYPLINELGQEYENDINRDKIDENNVLNL